VKRNYPRVSSSNGHIDIVGEQSYQDNIRHVILYDIMVEKDDMEYHDDKLEACLVLEDENQYNPGNAVRVDIEGKTVGYLDRRNAEEYRRHLDKLNASESLYFCDAFAAGKRESSRQKMKFGVWLSMVPWDFEIELNPPPRKKLFGIF
jgi:hypothetical protein